MAFDLGPVVPVSPKTTDTRPACLRPRHSWAASKCQNVDMTLLYGSELCIASTMA